MQNIMKNIYYLSLTLLLLFSTVSNAQWQSGLWTGKQAYNWCFPDTTGVNFDTSPPSRIYSALNSIEGNEGFGAISDEQGNLLFYVDPHTVWNRNHEVMLNGAGLLGGTYGSSSQSGLVVPKPNSPGIYYIFTIDEIYSSDGFRYSEVDMSLDGGLGGITLNKNILLSEGSTEKLTATFHADGQSVWVACRDATAFKTFRVTENGVETAPVITESIDITTFVSGQMKFSPDGSKLALINGYDVPLALHVLDFNNETGRFSNLQNLSSLIETEITGFGIEFSADSRYVYYTYGYLNENSEFVYALHQVDLLAGNEQDIINSDFNIHTSQPYVGSATELQLAPDGKIYLPYNNGTSLNVINFPNNPGPSCGFESDGLPLKGTIFAFALPNFIQSYFESGILHEGECFGEAVTFSTLRIPGITSITWNFGDTASGADNTSTALTPSHTYTAPGTYTVTAIAITNGVPQTTTSEVIVTTPDAVVPIVPGLCADANGNAIFNLEALSSGILNGQDAAMFTVTYFASEADLQADNPIVTPANFTTTGQTIYAKVTNTGTGCTTKIQFNLPVNPLPQAATPATLSKCGTPAGTAAFNLKNQDAAILNGQDAANFTVNYFLDANAQNAITTPESFTSSGQTVYAVVSNNSTGCTSGIVSFNVAVTEVSLFTQALQLTGCSPFNLNLISNQLEEGLIFTFYTTQQDAENESDAIANQEQYTTPAKEAVVYVRTQNTDGCVDITDVVLQQGDCSIPKGISPNGDEKNDSFDLSGFDVSYLGIYNRYGQEVYSKDNYTSEWHGQSGNNSELPTGTYYYMVKRNDGRSETGWVYVNREEK
jgi:gliding motility-associated-like protein